MSDDDLQKTLAKVYEKMLADTTPMEPEFMKALYSNRSALYTTFEDGKLKTVVVDTFKDDPPA